MHQGLELELAYLTESDYTRVPYRPLLNLDSRFAYGYGNWYFNLIFYSTILSKTIVDTTSPKL